MLLNPSEALAIAKAASELNNIGAVNMRTTFSSKDSVFKVTFGLRRVWIEQKFGTEARGPALPEVYQTRQAFFKAYGLD